MQLSDLRKARRGVDIVQATPFNKDGNLDLEGMRANTRWLVERTAGKDFIFTPLGGTGEFYAMSDDERKAVLKMVVEEVKGKNVILAGAAQAGTPETIKMCQYAESIGADGALVVLPYYHVPEEEGMYQHYKQVAENVGKDFGIMIYNNPEVSGSWIKPPLMAKLSKIPNIIALKESTPYVASFYAMQRAVDPNDMVVLADGEQMFSFVALHGCPGFVSSAANYAPELSYSIYEVTVTRDFNKLIEIIEAMAPYFSFMSRATANHGPHTGISEAGGNMFVGVEKAAMDIVGLRGGEVRLPLVGLNEEEKTELRYVLRAMRLLK